MFTWYFSRWPSFIVYTSASVGLPIVIHLRIGVGDELEEPSRKIREPSDMGLCICAVPMVDSGHSGDARTSGSGILSGFSMMLL